MIDPKALEAARFLVDAYSKRRPPGDAEPYALIVARALLAGEGNNVDAGAAPRTSTAEAKLREALKPFAEFAGRFGAFARDDDWVLTRNPSNKGNLTMGDVRRARAAYAGKDASGEKAGITQASDSLARPCTCHPNDRPPMCMHRYAASECQKAYYNPVAVACPSPAVRDASLDEKMKPLFAAAEIEGVARAICKTQGLCKYVGPRCNTSRCTVTPQTAQAAIQAAGAVRDVTLREEWRSIDTVPKDGRTIKLQAEMLVHYLERCKFQQMPWHWRPETPQTEWRVTGWQEVAPSSDQAALSHPSLPDGEGNQ